MPKSSVDEETAAAASLLLQKNGNNINSHEKQLNQKTTTMLKKRTKQSSNIVIEDRGGKQKKKQKKTASINIDLQQAPSGAANNDNTFQGQHKKSSSLSLAATNSTLTQAVNHLLQAQELLGNRNGVNNGIANYNDVNNQMKRMATFRSRYENSAIPQHITMLHPLHNFLQLQQLQEQQLQSQQHLQSDTGKRISINNQASTNNIDGNINKHNSNNNKNRNLFSGSQKTNDRLKKKRDPETKRLVHNMAEKRRQHRINDYIKQLRQVMLDFTQTIIPKGKSKVLQNSIDFIQTLIEDNLVLHQQCNELEAIVQNSGGAFIRSSSLPLEEAVKQIVEVNSMKLHWGREDAMAGAKHALQRINNEKLLHVLQRINNEKNVSKS